jgi:hypothetical protein
MRYDLELIHQLCQEIGFSSVVESKELIKIQLSSAMVLCFQNSEKEEDCLVCFEGAPWHTHDDIIFSNAQGMFTELSYLDIISGLDDGQILVCERLLQTKVMDRWLIHRDYNDINNEFKYMAAGEELKVIRVSKPDKSIWWSSR